MQIHNNGPSNIKSLNILVFLPLTYIDPLSLERETLVDIDSVSAIIMHNDQVIDVKWTQNDAISSSFPLNEYEINGDQLSSTHASVDEFVGNGMHRRSDENSHFNQYSQRVVEMPNSTASNRLNAMENRPKTNITSTNDRILANLHPNRTIYFDCKNAKQANCLQGKFTVPHFNGEDLPVMITLNFTLTLKNVAKIMTEKRDVLVARTSVKLLHSFNEDT